jgi:hypothetical protein
MPRPILTIALLYCTTLTALAQSSQTPPPPRPISEWPTFTANLPANHSINIITLARPNHRQTCRVNDLAPDIILCGSAQKPTTYQREDIAAIIDPPDHTERNIMLIPVALLVASLAASFFVPLVWSITLRIFSGLCLAAYGATGDGAQGTDHNHDILLYQRPNTPLTVKLR